MENLHKRFCDLHVLKGVSLSARDGEAVAIIGGPGSGKSTLLRCINSLENPTSGIIRVNGEEIRLKPDGRGGAMPADRRQIERIRSRLGMAFQSFNLWSHMTLLQNVIEVPVHVLTEALPLAALGTLNLLALEPPGWGGVLLEGLLASLQIALGAFCLGLLIGKAGAFGKLYGGPVLRDLLEVYTTVVRAVPELILLLYYAGTDLLNRGMAALGYGPVDISGLVAGIAVLGVVQGAYSTEVIRSAILAVPQGQIEAGRAYGMSPGLLLRRVTLPAMLPFAIPGLANLWLLATKDTALLTVVGFNELTLATRQAAGSTKAYFTFFMAAGALYLTVTLFSNVIIGRVERWSRRGLPAVAA